MATLARTTKLEAVNTLLRNLGDSPVSALDLGGSVLVEKAQTQLDETSRMVQTRGWRFNTDYEFTFVREAVTNYILVPGNVLFITPSGKDRSIDAVLRDDRMWDRRNNTYVWTQSLVCDVTWYLEFEDLPEAARQYITIAAARVLQASALGSDSQEKFTLDDEMKAMALLQREDTAGGAGKRNYFRGSATTLGFLWGRQDFPRW